LPYVIVIKKIIMPDQEKDKQFNLWGLIILLVSVTVFLAVISYVIDYIY